MLSYLSPLLKKKPKNFVFRKGSTVTRVLFNDIFGIVGKTATGVEYP